MKRKITEKMCLMKNCLKLMLNQPSPSQNVLLDGKEYLNNLKIQEGNQVHLIGNHSFQRILNLSLRPQIHKFYGMIYSEFVYQDVDYEFFNIKFIYIFQLI